MPELPKSDAVAKCWEHYRSTKLSMMGHEPPDPTAIDVAKASFYFGSLAMLGIIEPVAEKGRPQSLALVLEGLRKEVEAFLVARPGPLN